MASHMLQHLMLYLSILIGFCSAHQEEFVKCMSKQSSSFHTNTSKYVYSLHSPSYFSLFQPLIHNARWKNSIHQRPKFIVTPTNNLQIKAAIICARAHAFQIRVLSGGHDFEGLSYRSRHRFVLIDLVNLRSITINMDDETAWVQAGATLGELYYNIAKKSDTHAFPAGLCPSVGVGGHISGGGMGTLVRKYGLAADNIIDAKIMNAKGEILDRELMGEDLFWAIRGGGGASFGIIFAWRVQLVRVPSLTTVFTVYKHLDDTGIEVVDKWQKIANKLPNDLFIRIILSNNVEKNTQNKPKFARVAFNSLFLGKSKDLLALMNTNFPELGLQEADCQEMSWINSTLYFSSYTNQPLEILLNRTMKYKVNSMKGKSDFATVPLPKSAYHGINERLEKENSVYVIIMDPYGGKMDEIEENETPFPHRKGNLFNIVYLNIWDEGEKEKKHLKWSREMYDFMEPYVSSSPRRAYLNYRDLDLGFQKKGERSYSRAIGWGEKYFNGNFERLAKVKKMVDQDNFFGDMQSVPPIS